eukprot:scaffold5930_cov177-Cylindrotheca_fusiformis.AAC.6
MPQSSTIVSSFSFSICLLVSFLSFGGLARSLPDGASAGIVQIGQYVPLEGICTAYIKEILADVVRQELVCHTSNGRIFAVPSADQEWIDEKQKTGELISGETILDLPPNTMVDMEKFSLDLAYPPGLLNTVDEDSRNRRRQLRRLAITGTKTVLAIRVIASDASASMTESEISDGIFGTIDDPANLVTQYKACSFGKLQFKPMNDKKGKTRNIKDGATTIKIDIPTSQGDEKLMDAVNAKLVTEFGTSKAEDLADHIMYCLPPGTLTEKQLAFAFVNGYQIWFNDVNCGYLTVQMHEMGHNLGMGHSGEDNSEYGDTSGLMGSSYKSDDTPFMCFNSAKSWQLGWYEDKAVTVAPKAGDASFSIKLAGIVDYDTTDANVLIRIVPDTLDTHYYMNYNAAKGMNKASTEGRDQVLVTKKDVTYEKNVSWRIAELDATNTFKLNDFNGKSGETLTITVNSIVDDVADISIVLSGFSQTNPTTAPTSKPSLAPSTSPPTAVPSHSPSAQPTLEPSVSPSTMDSEPPSQALSGEPSAKPTSLPSTSPTAPPTASATASPSGVSSSPPSTMTSQSPSQNSSTNPTTAPAPSAVPTTAPSTAPSTAHSLSPTDTAPVTSTSVPTSLLSAVPSPSLGLVPTTSLPTTAPSIQPSAAPSVLVSTQMTAAVPLAVDVSVLDKLDVICNGAEAYIDQVVQNAFGSDTRTTVTCSQSTTDRSRRSLFLEYEKPVVAIVTTTFPRAHTAPREFRYIQYLNQVMVAEDAAAALPAFISEAAKAGGSGLDDGVYTSVDRTVDPPMLVIEFSATAPSGQPTQAPTTPTGKVEQTLASEGTTLLGGLWFPFVLALTMGLVSSTIV